MRHLVLAVVLLAVLPGCQSFEGEYSFANTRILMASDTPVPLRWAASPFVYIPEWITFPISTYIDSTNTPPRSEDGHVYWSYAGTRTMLRSDLNNFYKVTAFPWIAFLDTLWFPLGGVVDLVYTISN